MVREITRGQCVLVDLEVNHTEADLENAVDYLKRERDVVGLIRIATLVEGGTE
jgi:hypothetical protein